MVEPAYITPQTREKAASDSRVMPLTPFNVQRVVYEIILNHLLVNDPADMGFPGLKINIVLTKQGFVDQAKSDIYLQLGNQFDAEAMGKRPAILIKRGQAQHKKLTLGGHLQGNVAESEQHRATLDSMVISLDCIHRESGIVESLSDFIKIPVLKFREEVIRDFCFVRFDVVQTTEPQLVQENKDFMSVQTVISLAWVNHWLIKGDHLKLKTVSRYIFDGILNRPIENQ